VSIHVLDVHGLKLSRGLSEPEGRWKHSRGGGGIQCVAAHPQDGASTTAILALASRRALRKDGSPVLSGETELYSFTGVALIAALPSLM